MRFLAIDTSSDWMKIALEWDDEVFSILEKRKRRNDDLMREVDALFKKVHGDMDKLDGLGCVVGPGKFTGLRTGLAVIKAIAFAKNLKIAALSYAECVGINAPSVLLRRARKGWWYFSEFDGKNWSFSLKNDEALQNVSKDIHVISEEPVEVATEVRTPLFDSFDMLEALKEAFEKEDLYDHLSLKPLYVQRPVAEENLLKKRREK